MTSFNGPSSSDLVAFKKSVQSMPDQYKSSFASVSKETLEKLCEPDVLHVWETDSDIENLLQLTSVIAKLCNLGTRKNNAVSASDGSMLIIAEEKAGRNNFARICHLVEYLTGADGKKHLEGTVAAFGSVVVVKGWNNVRRSEDSRASSEADKVVKRINTSIERVFKMGKFPSGKKKLVWHHGPVLHFLLHWINNTTSNLRSSLHAITVTGSLDLADSVKPSTAGRANTLPDLERLETFAKKLDIPVVFLDASSQLITYNPLPTYMYYYAYYINTFLPASLSRPHLHKAQDDLVTFAFRLLGASKDRYNDTIVRKVKDHLDRSSAQKWAKACLDPRSYEKAKCRAAGKETEIHRAVHLADSPFARFSTENGLPAFARLAVGPAASSDYHTAAPVQIDFKKSRLRATSSATFHILLPGPGQDLEKVTNRIQGMMMAVLERVRQEKGNPVFGSEEREMWKGVVKACTWALKECEGKMPKSVDGKVKFVREKMEKGTWGYAMSGSEAGKSGVGGEEQEMSDAAKANAAAVKTYGAGSLHYGQPQMATANPHAMVPVYGQQAPIQAGYGASQSSPVMGLPKTPGLPIGANPVTMYTQSHGVPAPVPGWGQDSAYARSQGVGGTYAHVQQLGRRERSGYSQSMGGKW
jgi:hypothetical protein